MKHKNYRVFAIFSIVALLLSTDVSAVLASEFSGNEDAWLERCSIPQETSKQAQECAEFKEYYAAQSASLQKEVSALSDEIKNIGDDIKKLNSAVKQQEQLIETIDAKIEANEMVITRIDKEIKVLDKEIARLQVSIDERNAIITGRMQEDQASIGTNMTLEIIMGSADIVDMLRRLDGLQRINAADQKEIDTIKEEKKQQDLQKEEKVRLKEDAEAAKKDNEEQKENAETLKRQKETLIEKFQQKEAELNEQMRAVKVDIDTIRGNMSSISTAVAGSLDFSGNGKLAKPVNGTISAHSFYYPNGSVHMGLDVAVPLRTPIYAPADGIIVYANNPVPTNSGYIGNTTGYPAGTGNSIHMLTQVDGITYALSFFHMAQENFSVSAGQTVKQGQLLGLSGNTGNTTGPHCHLEVINLGGMSMATAISRFQATADFAWGCGWSSAGLANICEVKGAPCREHPENVYGY